MGFRAIGRMDRIRAATVAVRIWGETTEGILVVLRHYNCIRIRLFLFWWVTIAQSSLFLLL